KAAPPEAAYRQALEKRIAEVNARTKSPAPKSAASNSVGPGAADIEAAARLSPEQREAMIAGMVDGLAARLKRDGKDLPAWLRLLNAYVVLGRQGDARAA